MANSCFWLFNTLLLLYYLRRDPHVRAQTIEYHGPLGEMINMVCVFVIRDAEQRIDKILDAAMLDYESLPGFEDVRFEGEWRFVKALTSRASLAPGAATNSSGRSSAQSLRESVSAKASVLGLFGNSTSPESGNGQSSPEARRGQSLTNLRSPPTPGPTSVSPRNITSILSAVLFLMQAYEIHPCFIVQAFSQIFYWTACETANRIINRVSD